MQRPTPVEPFDATATVRPDLTIGPDAAEGVRVRVLAAVAHDLIGPPQYLVEYTNHSGRKALGYALEVQPCKS